MKPNPRLIFFVLISFGIVMFSYYATHGELHLLYADAISRLNISRKVIDNITPGLAQVGNVWLPLPQILMLPFIWNDFLWQSGLAGTFMSVTCFALGGYFIYRAAYLLTNSSFASLCSVLLYALNINVMYLQTTAMSEALFLCTLAATMYYFIDWFKTDNKVSLLFAAFSVSAMTLTRYEGLAVLLSSIPMVFIWSYLRNRKFSSAEGQTVIYSTLACLGFALWTLYLAVIFGNPLYWRDYYATPQATGGGVEAYSQAKPFLEAVWQYFTSFTWMVGLIPTIFSILGILIVGFISYRKKSFIFLPLLMPLSIFLFMVLTLQRNTPIVQPTLNWANIISPDTSKQVGFNIRYGILLMPWVAIISSYLFAAKNVVLRSFLILLFSMQIISYFVPQYTVIYKIPDNVHAKPYSDFVNWMKENYDGGKILISASSHEDQMFEMGFPYRTYIHEGNNKYWKESLDNPSRYAKWVVLDVGHSSDQVSRHMNRIDILEREYELVFERDQVKVYKKYDDPYYEIN